MPAYNAEKFIAQAIQSVLGQTYDNLELVVIDDGSIDGTARIVHTFRDERIKYFHQNNTGVSTARNRGLEQAKGEYIAFLDADDLFLPEKLFKQVQAILNMQEVGLVAGGYSYINERGEILFHNKPWISYGEINIETILLSYPFVIHSFLVKKESIDKIGGFDPDLSFGEDCDLLFRLKMEGCKMIWIDEIVCFYRLHKENAIKKADSVTQGHRRILDKFFSLYGSDEEIKRLSDKAYEQYDFVSAIRSYRYGKEEQGKGYLRKYFAENKVNDYSYKQSMTDRIGEITCDPLWNQPAYSLIDFIWRNLPEEWSDAAKFHKQAKAYVARRLFFEAKHLGNRLEMLKHLVILLLNDTSLLNRGMIKVLFLRTDSHRIKK